MQISTVTGNSNTEADVHSARRHVVKVWGPTWGGGTFTMEEEVETDVWVPITDSANPPTTLSFTSNGAFEYAAATTKVRGVVTGGTNSVVKFGILKVQDA